MGQNEDAYFPNVDVMPLPIAAESSLRRASVVEWGTVVLPNGPGLSPSQLHALLAESGRGEPREYRVSVDAFADLMSAGPS